jgi:hypothetical protein
MATNLVDIYIYNGPELLGYKCIVPTWSCSDVSGDMAQVIEQLTGKCKVLSSKRSATRKKMLRCNAY